jgi:dTDP-4-amino-4,6-dideoxygalactose transaminase
MNWKIPLSSPDLGPEEEAAVLRVLASGWLTMGAETQAFEEEFARYLGVKHALACSSGTAALHLAMLALGVNSESVVIQPAVNFVAAANMTVACGATPVFADICSLAEPTVRPTDIKDHLDTLPPGTKAVVIVMHYGGFPCRMDEILAICRPRGVSVIEDACHGPGGSYQGATPGSRRRLGTIGDVGCFSFFSNKNLATGEGGMVVTDRDELPETMRLLRSHGMTTLTWDRHRGHAASYDVAAHGFNYRIDEIRSALGRAQLKNLDERNRRRRDLVRRYWTILDAIREQGWGLPFRALEKDASFEGATGHLMPVVAVSASVRQAAADALRESGIQSSLHYPLLPAFTAFSKRYATEKCSQAKSFCERVITLPLYPSLSDGQVTDVCAVLTEAVLRTQA